MRVFHRLRALVRNLFRRSAVERDLNDELASYVALAADEEREKGLARDAAERHARLQLGGATAVTEAVRAGRAGAWLEQVWQDARYALRGLAKAPGYAAGAILILALGIGANIAVFAVVDAALFKPLPYRNPDQLVEIAQVLRRGTGEQVTQIGMTWEEFDRWRAEPSLFVAVEAFIGQRVRVDGAGVSRRGFVFAVTPGMMRLLGVQPILGRPAAADGAEAMLTEEFWRSAWGADPGVLGRTLTLDAKPYAIVGVMPASVRWRLGGSQTIAWIGLDERGGSAPGGRTFIGGIARLRPGLTFDAAQAALARRVDQLQSGVAPDQRWDAELLPLDRRGGGWAAGKARALVALLGAVGFVLLIACANIANLVFARVLGRQHEIAVRAALGATRGRLVRQLLTENAVLAAGGAAGALVLASWTTSMIPRLVPEDLELFAANQLTLDARALGFGVLAALVTLALCALIPALRAARPGNLSSIGNGSRIVSIGGGCRLRQALQIAETVLTSVLLIGAGLLAASFIRMAQTRPGYDVERLVSAGISTMGEYRGRVAEAAFTEELLARLREVPGLRAAIGQSPAGGFAGRMAAYGRENDAVNSAMLSVYYVGPDYFSVTGIPVKSGRTIGPMDTAASAPVALIDERAAELFWPGQSPLGQQFRYGPWAPWTTVVGVVGRVKTRWFTERGGTIQAYVPASQRQLFGSVALVVRADGDPVHAAEQVRSLVRATNAALETDNVVPVDELYADVLIEPRFFLVLMTVFAGIALVTATVGLYSVVNYAVSRRAREIGVRIALGADLGRVRRLVVAEAMKPLSVGLCAGLAGAWWLARVLSAQLYETSVHDSRVFGAVTILIVAVGLLAAYLPARRATRINPVETLRAE